MSDEVKVGAFANVLSKINKLATETPADTVSYYCCADCKGITGTSSGQPSACPACGVIGGFMYPGATREEAIARYTKAQLIDSACKVTITEETADGQVISTPTVTVTPVTAPIVEPTPAPVAKVSRAAALKAKADARTQELRDEAAVAAGGMTSSEKKEAVVQALPKANLTELRRDATAAFIEKHHIQEFQMTPVGTALVQAVGFTVWVDQKPQYRIQESFETGKEFAEAFNEYRAEQPSARIDVAACINASDPELVACLFRGDMVVGLSTSTGTKQVRRGDVIKIGAVKTSKGNLRFNIL